MIDWPRARADEIDEEVRSLIRLMMQGEATSEGIARMHRLLDERTKNMMRPRCARRPVTSFFASLTPEQQAAVLAYGGPDGTQTS